MSEASTSFPNDFRTTHRAGDVIRDYEERISDEPLDEHVRVGGRVVARRNFGKAGFVHLLDGTGKIQVHGAKDVLGDDAYAVFKALRPGDIVGVDGCPFRTKTGEITISAREVRLLVKPMRGLPEKWHGLKDVETRYRRRYLDLIATEEVRKTFRMRAEIVHLIRGFLVERGFLEVETPMMQALAGGATARPFRTHHNALDLDLFLRVAPELYLKRLVVGGLDRVFEMSRCFRNEGLSTRHNPEFTMLEFYQAFANYHDLIELTEELFGHLGQHLAQQGLLENAERLVWGETEISLARPFRRVALRSAVAEALGEPVERMTDAEFLAQACASRHLEVAPDASAGDLAVVLFEELVEHTLVNPTFVTDFPVEVSPLARRRDDDASLVERFELFVAGRELANAFSELNDPVDQRARFEEQVASDPSGEKRLDEDYVQALEHGLPPTAGEGIGIDRLVMLFAGAASIRDVLLFPQLRPEDPAR